MGQRLDKSWDTHIVNQHPAFSGEFGFEVGELDPEITFIGRNKAEHGGTVYPEHEQISK